MRELLSFACFYSLCGIASGAVIETPHGARQPQVVVDASGNVHVTFGAESKVFYSCSTNDGSTFSRPVEIAKLQSLALGMRRGPRVAVSGDAIVITAIGSGNDGDGNLYSWRSEDQGVTWQGPFRVNDVDTSAREGLHGMAAGPTGELYCTWLDLRHKGSQVFGSRSIDGGVSWLKNVLVYQSPDGTVCECCHPSVAMDKRGRVHVMWRNSLDGNRDMFLATSSDRGETFESAVKLGEGSWPLNACPMDGGAVAISADGKINTVWRRDHEVFVTDAGIFREKRLGEGMQPWAAADQHGVYMVWVSNRTGRLYSAKSVTDQPVELSDDAQYPVIAAHSTGNGPVVVAWESEEKTGPLIKVVTIDRE